MGKRFFFPLASIPRCEYFEKLNLLHGVYTYAFFVLYFTFIRRVMYALGVFSYYGRSIVLFPLSQSIALQKIHTKCNYVPTIFFPFFFFCPILSLSALFRDYDAMNVVFFDLERRTFFSVSRTGEQKI